MGATQTSTSLDSVVQQLAKEEQRESLQYLIEKLPEMTSALKSVEGMLSFVVASLGDQQSLGRIADDVEEKVERLHLTKDHLDAMLTLVHKLPNLVPVINKVEEFGLFVTDVLQDEKSVQYLIDQFGKTIPVQKGMEIVEETNEKFKEREGGPNISLFGMMRLLKDPTVQKGLKYVDSLLTVINEKNTKV